ncbi:MAG TPA: hypothetical protein PKL83_04175, partial [bacterium]|nr:hypothetical protein [bacterium]
MPSEKDIAAWRAGYEKQLAGWTENYTSVNEHFGNLIRKSWAKTAYVARVSHFNPAEMLICPPHSALNMGPTQEHRDDYGTGLFEGSSAEPVVDASGAITAINVILQQPRLERLKRSLQARGYQLPVSLEQFAQSALDIVAIHGASVVTTDDGKPTRAYLRPSAGPGVGTWGVSFKPGYFIEASNLTFRWGHYFPDAQRIYEETGANVCITGAQRLFPITGKHASNYGAAASEGNLARAMQYDELIYLAPYVIKNGAIEGGIQSLDALLKYGVLADGPGEEVFGIHKDGNTIIY